MKIIITGSTGMVGKGVLLECLDHAKVEQVLVINRSPLNMSHSKLTEIIHTDFMDFGSVAEQLADYDACFHCMGVSAVGMSELQYTALTLDVTQSLVNTLLSVNDNMVFTYVSGTGTDSSETGRSMWARIKGQTENFIFNAGFKDAYAFRPGVILPEKGVKSKTSWYNAMYTAARPLFPVAKKLPLITTSTAVGLAMINVVTTPQKLKILENRDINRIAGL